MLILHTSIRGCKLEVLPQVLIEFKLSKKKKKKE